MATEITTLTTDWTNITTALSLVVDSVYVLQNAGSTLIYVHEGPTPPGTTDRGFLLHVGLVGAQLKQEDNPVYARSQSGVSSLMTTESY